MMGNKLMKVPHVLSSLILIVFFSSKFNCEVSINSSIGGREGESLNLFVTWTDETFIQAQIDKLGPYNIANNNHDVIYRLLCVIDNKNQKCNCPVNNQINIDATCSSKSIIWTFTSLEIGNNGIYRIQLIRSGDNILKNVTVRVFGHPRNISLYCESNDCSTTINCDCRALSGNPKSSHNWILQRRNGEKINLTDQSNTKSLNVWSESVSSLQYEVEMEDEGGELSCSVENEYGSISDNVSIINVKYAPQIITFNKNTLIFNESDSLQLFCNVSANPQAEIMWILPDGTEIKNDNIQISELKPKHSGKFSCIATNCIGTSNQNVTVIVQSKPSNISLNCQQDNCSNIVTCQCQASAGNPKSRLHWMLQTVDGDNKDLSNHTNTDDFDIFGDIRSNLTYRVEVEDHRGSVSCVVENQLDSIRRESVKLHFYYPPTILSPKDPILKRTKSQSSPIKCNVNGFPKPNLFWIYPNTTQSNGNLLSISQHDGDVGNYSCHASNCMGNTTKQFQIIVQYGPTCESLNQSVIFIHQQQLNSTIRIGCRFSSLPLSDVDWMFTKSNQITTQRIDRKSNNYHYIIEEIIVSNVEKLIYLTLESIKSEDRGVYSCRARNVLNSCSSSIDLKVAGPPDRPTNLKIIKKTGKSGKPRLSWTPGYDGGSTQIFRISYEMFGKPVVEFTSNNYTDIDDTNLKPNSMIIIFVTAKNKFGPGQPSESIKYSVLNRKLKEFEDKLSNLLHVLIAVSTIFIVIILVLIVLIILLWLHMKGKVSLQCSQSQSTENNIKSKYKTDTMTDLTDIQMNSFNPDRNSSGNDEEYDYTEQYEYSHPRYDNVGEDLVEINVYDIDNTAG